MRFVNRKMDNFLVILDNLICFISKTDYCIESCLRRYVMTEPIFDVELLYFDHGNVIGSSLHNHSFFQLEYCIEGTISALGNKEEMILHSGDYWLIPPGCMHKFYKNKERLDFITVKFFAPITTESKIGHDEVERYYLEEIRAILAAETSIKPYAEGGKKIIEHHISGVLRHLINPWTEVSKSNLEQIIQNTIYKFGAAIDVNILAAECKMTRTEFKYRFRQEIGHGRIKDYIASILLKMIEERLLYSDSPLNIVADELHFPSAYAFSRYFKHHRGITPSEFRHNTKL